MSIVERAFEKVGIEVERDVPKPGHRRCSDWAKAIGMLRRLEAEATEEREKWESEFRKMTVELREAERERNDLQRQVDAYRLKERLMEVGVRQKDSEYLLTGKRESA